jgi:L-ribulose-5-phosphate 4-epimerase
MTAEEINGDYEAEQGKVILETFAGKDPMHQPGCVCAHHGPFAWGKDAAGAVYNAVVMEECAKMAAWTRMINPGSVAAPQYMLDKHFLRKHGKGAYYGQVKKG